MGREIGFLKCEYSRYVEGTKDTLYRQQFKWNELFLVAVRSFE